MRSDRKARTALPRLPGRRRAADDPARCGGWPLAGRARYCTGHRTGARRRRRRSPGSPRLLARTGGSTEPGDEIDDLAHTFDRYLSSGWPIRRARTRILCRDASHELRTPLAVIRGAAEVLAEDPAGLSPAQRERVARIERATDEMGELIAALLLLAREDRTPDDETCDARHIALDCIERYRPFAASRGHRAELRTAHRRWSTSRHRLPCSRSHSPTWCITPWRIPGMAKSPFNSTRQLTVRDSGSGIRDEALARVFERHYRGPESAGAGIGLSWSSAYATGSAGKSNCGSEATNGTTGQACASRLLTQASRGPR
jgi:signal transduction histidine kinase